MIREKIKRQSERGVDRTYRTMGTVPFKMLRMEPHTNFIKAELSMRCLEFGNGNAFKWKPAISILKLHERNAKALNPITNFDKCQNSIDDVDVLMAAMN